MNSNACNGDGRCAADIRWAILLANELHQLPRRSPARHARLAVAIAARLDAAVETYFLRLAPGDPPTLNSIHPLTLIRPRDAAARKSLRSMLELAVRGEPTSGSTHVLVHVQPVRPDRAAAIVCTRPPEAQPFDAGSAAWLAAVHAGSEWLYSIYVAPPEDVIARLSPREKLTLEHLLAGATEKEVAQRIGRSPHTVHAYVKQLYKTLGVNSRRELMAIFMEVGQPAPNERSDGNDEPDATAITASESPLDD